MAENDPNTATGTLMEGTPADDGAGHSREAATQTAGDWIPTDLKDNKSLARYKSPQDLAKAYVTLESLQGSMVRIPAENASPEEKAKFYSKIGRPDKAEAYELPTSDVGTSEDVSAFAPMALEANLTKVQAKRIWDWSQTMAKERLEAAKAGLEKQREAKRQALQTKWGEDFHGKADLASKVAKRFGGDDLLALMRRTRLGDEPEVLETFAAIGEVLSEDILLGGTRRAESKPAELTAKDMYPKSPKLK